MNDFRLGSPGGDPEADTDVTALRRDVERLKQDVDTALAELRAAGLLGANRQRTSGVRWRGRGARGVRRGLARSARPWALDRRDRPRHPRRAVARNRQRRLSSAGHSPRSFAADRRAGNRPVGVLSSLIWGMLSAALKLHVVRPMLRRLAARSAAAVAAGMAAACGLGFLLAALTVWLTAMLVRLPPC